MIPKDIHILVPRVYEYHPMGQKQDFADVMKLRTFRWGVYLGLSGWALSAITCIPMKAAEGELTQMEEEEAAV